MDTDHTYSISQLAELAEVTPRTIRYYTSEGLLPVPETHGKYARYTEDHLNRLRLIVQLKAAYLPLHEIRERIGDMDAQRVATMLAEVGSGGRLAEETSASDYIASVIGRQQALQPPAAAPSEAPALRAPALSAAPSMPTAAPAPTAQRGGFFRRLIPSRRAEPEQEASGEAWRRITLAPGVELHIREPAEAPVQTRIQTLLARAREIFESDG